MLEPELRKAAVLRGVKKLQDKFNVKVNVEKLTGNKQFVVFPQ